MIDHYAQIEAAWTGFRSRFHRPVHVSLEDKMTVQTDNLLAAATALKTTADATATAAAAAAEAAAQSAVDSVTATLAAANGELAPLVTPAPAETVAPAA